MLTAISSIATNPHPIFLLRNKYNQNSLYHTILKIRQRFLPPPYFSMPNSTPILIQHLRVLRQRLIQHVFRLDAQRSRSWFCGICSASSLCRFLRRVGVDFAHPALSKAGVINLVQIALSDRLFLFLLYYSKCH